MKDERKTKAQLIDELKELRQRVAELEAMEDQPLRSEPALHEGEERYRLMAENATDVIWAMDLNLRFTYTSPSARRLRGYDADDEKALSLKEVLTPASFEIAAKALEDGLANEQISDIDPSRSRTLELEVLRKDGATVWVETKMTFLRDSEGKPIEILGVTRDITERKQVEPLQSMCCPKGWCRPFAQPRRSG